MITYDQKKQIQKAAYNEFSPQIKPSKTAEIQTAKRRIV